MRGITDAGAPRGGGPGDLESVGRVLYWPQVLLSEDLASAFRVSVATARRRLAAGDFGPRFRSGRRWAVRKSSLIDHLARCEVRGPTLRSVRP